MLYLVLVFGILPSLHNLLWLITVLYLIPTCIFSHLFIWKVQVFKKAVGSINFLFVCGFENYKTILLCLLKKVQYFKLLHAIYYQFFIEIICSQRKYVYVTTKDRLQNI